MNLLICVLTLATYSVIDCSQEKSHLPAMHVTCASSSATTWTDTRGCTAERSRTSVIAAIRLVCRSLTVAVVDYRYTRVVTSTPFFSLSVSRTSHGQTGCWDTGGYVQSGWAKKKATHRIHLPIQLPGARYSLPTTVWLSDTHPPTETLVAAAGCSSVCWRRTLELNITENNLA